MPLEWYSYWPLREFLFSPEARKKLPPDLVAELIDEPPMFERLLAVDASKPDVVARLDEWLQVGQSSEVIKDRTVEASRKEISAFSHFFVGPRILDLGKHVTFQLTAPCDQCPWGVQINGPIQANLKKLASVDVGELQRPLRLDIELVVSRRMRKIFDAEKITGLEYLSPLPEDAEGSDVIGYLARINSTAYQTGERIMLGNYCPQHSVAVAPSVLRRQTRREFLSDSDIQTINRVRVEGKEYFYQSPPWVVSQRLLRILLKEVRRLRRITIRLNEKFRPLVVD